MDRPPELLTRPASPELDAERAKQRLATGGIPPEEHESVTSFRSFQAYADALARARAAGDWHKVHPGPHLVGFVVAPEHVERTLAILVDVQAAIRRLHHGDLDAAAVDERVEHEEPLGHAGAEREAAVDLHRASLEVVVRPASVSQVDYVPDLPHWLGHPMVLAIEATP
jgi:hypothetical protein